MLSYTWLKLPPSCNLWPYTPAVSTDKAWNMAICARCTYGVGHDSGGAAALLALWRCCACFDCDVLDRGHFRQTRPPRQSLARKVRHCAHQRGKTCQRPPQRPTRRQLSRATSSMASAVTVTPCSSFQDCDAVAALCGSSFPEEVYSQGLSVQQWAQIEAEDLQNTPSWWRQIGRKQGRLFPTRMERGWGFRGCCGP